MSSSTNAIVITRDGAPFNDYDDAYAALLRFTKHSDGQLVSALYRIDNFDDPVRAIVAIGTKNWNECGPQGQYDPDIYLNKYYPSSSYPYGPCGPEFFDIISCCCHTGGVDPSKFELNNTAYLINGKTVVVANQNGSNEAVTDPFETSQLAVDFTRTNDPTIPQVPTPSPVNSLNDTEFDVNGELVTVANQNGEDEEVSNPFILNSLSKTF